MRILYFHQYFRTPAMPGATRSYEIARRLVARGHDVHIITSDQEPTSTEVRTTNESGIQVTWIPVAYSNRMAYAARIVAFLRFAINATALGLQWRPDVIFATSTPLTIGIPAIISARHWGAPFVFEVRDLWPQVPIAMGALRNPLLIAIARRLESLCYRSSAHIITLSPGMKEGVLRSGWVNDDAVSVIPNLTNPDLASSNADDAMALLSELNLPPHRRLLVYAGTLGHVNDVSYLVDVAAEILPLRPDYHFLIVGDGIEREKVEAHALNRRVLNRNFFMRDRIPKSRIPALLRAASLALSTVADIPELFDNSANKFFDALAAHVPVAINYGGWQADLIRSEGIGLVLPRSPEVAAAYLRDFLDDDDQLAAARANAARVAPHFSADRAAERIEQILMSVTSAHL